MTSLKQEHHTYHDPEFRDNWMLAERFYNHWIRDEDLPLFLEDTDFDINDIIKWYQSIDKKNLYYPKANERLYDLYWLANQKDINSQEVKSNLFQFAFRSGNRRLMTHAFNSLCGFRSSQQVKSLFEEQSFISIGNEINELRNKIASLESSEHMRIQPIPIKSLPGFFTQNTLSKSEKNGPLPVNLQGYPNFMHASFKLFNNAGAKHFALFGGAVRDADYAARHNQSRPIKDYDFRVWLSHKDYEANLEYFLGLLSFYAECKIEERPCSGTDKIRYWFTYNGIEFDLSIRPIPQIYHTKPIPPEAVAKDRASDSDVGLCAIAIDPTGQAWARLEYLQDQRNKTLTIYPSDDKKRIAAYTERMESKFPDHRIIELGAELSEPTCSI